MRIETPTRLLMVGALSAAVLLAQGSPLSSEQVRINLPKDSPVAFLGIATDQSRSEAQGSALVLDLHLSLTFRNASLNRIHGLTLRVVSQEVAPGGKNWVAYSGLNVGPGEAFPARIDMRLMRPVQMAGGPLVEVSLDGVMFQDLTFFGPDKLNSRRTMIAWEMEAQRDREHFKRVLAQSGRDGLAREIRGSLARQTERARWDVRVRPAVTSAAVASGERTEQFAFLELPDSPVQALSGLAQVAGSEARAPRIEVRNRSKRQVSYVELGWLVRDQDGRLYMAASVPTADPQLSLAAGQTAQVRQDTALTISRNGRRVDIQSMTGFVSQVEFSDGKVWVPSRQSIESTALEQVLPPSAEEQRLTSLYTRKGLDAVVQELSKE